MNIKEYVLEKAQAAKQASSHLARLPTEVKNAAIVRMADALEAAKERILQENTKDQESARKRGRSPAFIDRLTLTHKRISEMGVSIREVASLPDPVGEIAKMWRRPSGILVGRMRVPIGVIGVIYESRPNVTVESASLCLKSGNAVILRGGSDALSSNLALVTLLQETGEKSGLPRGGITFIDIPDHEAVLELLRLDRHIDLIIPRGGKELMRTVTEHSLIPVIRHDKGVCHTFVDRDADMEMAEEICYNAKVQRPGTCNAMETLLVHEGIAPKFLPRMLKRFEEAGVEIRGCPKTRTLFPWVKEATEEDWSTEYLDLILSVRIVNEIEEAIGHISRYGSRHSDAIVTGHYERAMRFIQEVDASAVFVNCSTRLNDGYQLGLGAEIGISTARIHARGPMGLEELTCQKFIVLGNGQLRE